MMHIIYLGRYAYLPTYFTAPNIAPDKSKANRLRRCKHPTLPFDATATFHNHSVMYCNNCNEQLCTSTWLLRNKVLQVRYNAVQNPFLASVHGLKGHKFTTHSWAGYALSWAACECQANIQREARTGRGPITLRWCRKPPATTTLLSL